VRQPRARVRLPTGSLLVVGFGKCPPSELASLPSSLATYIYHQRPLPLDSSSSSPTARLARAHHLSSNLLLVCDPNSTAESAAQKRSPPPPVASREFLDPSFARSALFQLVMPWPPPLIFSRHFQTREHVYGPYFPEKKKFRLIRVERYDPRSTGRYDNGPREALALLSAENDLITVSLLLRAAPVTATKASPDTRPLCPSPRHSG
jgi:hypothetical protein